MSRQRTFIISLGFALATFFALLSRAEAACTLGKLAELPITMSGMRPMVSGKINGVDVQFLAATGSSYSFLTPGSTAQLHLARLQAPSGIKAISADGLVNLSVATVEHLILSGHDLGRVDFLVGENEYGSNNVGMLAQNILGAADGDYDLANGMISLIKAQGCAKQPLVYWTKDKPYSVLSLDYAPDARFAYVTPPPVVIAYLNGVRIRVKFDTGQTTSVLSFDAAARAGITPSSPGVVSAGDEFGKRQTRKVWLAPIASFKIGNEEIKRTKLRIEKINFPDCDMLLGTDFFLSHHVYVANSQQKIYFTYIGGPVFNLTAPLPPVQPVDRGAPAVSVQDAEEPKTADGYSRRGQARLARLNIAGALADLDRATQLAPIEPQYFHERGMAHITAKQPTLAMQDFDRALELDPGYTPSLLARGEMRLNGRQAADALADFDVLDRLSAPQSDLRLLLGKLYSRMQRFEQANDQYDLWIKAHPDDSRKAFALNGRCWARAQLDQDLPQALADCDAALDHIRFAAALDSRGLVELRFGAYGKAIADYDAALALSPKLAWSLYGRGVAEIKTGHPAEGQVDIAAAAAVDPELPGFAKAARGSSPEDDSASERL